jgi:hypothetical protein
MSYSTATIGTLLADVNHRYFLPAIQRPYVWGPDQVITLMDSLLKGYPIGSFMFWAITEPLKQELRIYNFIENWQPGLQNTPTSTDGRDAILVLDGQQRMTSLLIALRGTFAEKAKFKRRANPDAWETKTLYIDLLHDPEEENEDEDANLGVSYGLRFHTHPPRSDYRHHWFRLGDILNTSRPDQLEQLLIQTEMRLHHGVHPFQRKLVRKTLQRLHQVIWQEEAVNYFTETSDSLERVLDIFVRANDGGVKLSKSDLLMSMITSKWQNGSAREKIYGFVDHINKSLGARNAINKDFVLKACLMLCTRNVQYNISSFTTETIAHIEREWDAIQDAVERAFRFLNGLGISAENLTSLNAVLPIVWYMYQTPGLTLRGSSIFEQQNARAIQRWLLNSLLMGVFAGTSDRTLKIARETLIEAGQSNRDFPEQQLYHALAIGGRQTQVDERAIEDLLALSYGKPKTFLILSLLYEGLDWNGTSYHIDHIIAQARTARRLLMSMNVPETRIQAIETAVNRVGNLQLLPAQENLEKGDMPFEAWISSRSDTYRQHHLISDRPDLWNPLMLPEFVENRETLIRERLLSLTSRMVA